MEGLFNPISILLHCANAAILLIALYFLLYKPVRKFMLARQARIDGDIERAQQAKVEAQEALDGVQAKLVQAKVEASGIRAEGAINAQKEADEIIAEAHVQEALILKQARSNAQAILEGAHEGMRDQAAELAVEIARAILQREVSAQDNALAVEDFLKKVN